jgi:predicted AAA+ superfamily ATPase
MLDSGSIERALLSQIKDWLFQVKVLIINGARQVGKTTLSKRIPEDSGISIESYVCQGFN